MALPQGGRQFLRRSRFVTPTSLSFPLFISAFSFQFINEYLKGITNPFQQVANYFAWFLWLSAAFFFILNAKWCGAGGGFYVF
jgi:hypothetical protein